MAIFSPRPRSDREHLKFGQDNTAADTTPVYVQVGGKVQSATYSADDFAILNFDTNGNLKTIGTALSSAVDSVKISGDVAHDAVDSGNPVKIGGKAYNQDGTVPGTAVVELDRANFITDLYGRQYVSTEHPNFFSVSTVYTTAQTETQLKAKPGAGLSLYLTDVVLSVGETANTLRLKDGNAGGTNVDIVPPMGFAANGGAVLNLRTPLKLVANSSLAITSTGGGNHSVLISGYVGA